MEIFLSLYELIDKALMPFYRFPGNPLIGYYLGTVVLAFVSMIIGEYSISFAYRLNESMISQDNHRINHFQALSFEALKAGDKALFQACNGIANEAYGKSFFTQIMLAAASLWPLFIALGWLQYRFAEVEFHLPFSGPLPDVTFGYFPTFLLCHIVMRLMLKKIRRLIFPGKNLLV